MGAIYRKEMSRCFGGGIGYLVVCALLLLAGIFTFLGHFVSGMTDFSTVMLRMQWGLIGAIPLLCMHSFAAERRMGTERMLASLPLTAAEIVMGKFAALVTVFLIPTVITALYPLLLNAITEIPLGTAYGVWAGYLLLGIAMISFGMLLSSLTEHELVAGLLTLLALLLLYFLPTLAELLSGISFLSWLGDLFMLINPFSRLSGFAYGYFDWTSVLLYLSWIAVSLLLVWRGFQSRRYTDGEVMA